MMRSFGRIRCLRTHLRSVNDPNFLLLTCALFDYSYFIGTRWLIPAMFARSCSLPPAIFALRRFLVRTLLPSRLLALPLSALLSLFPLADVRTWHCVHSLKPILLLLLLLFINYYFIIIYYQILLKIENMTCTKMLSIKYIKETKFKAVAGTKSGQFLYFFSCWHWYSCCTYISKHQKIL